MTSAFLPADSAREGANPAAAGTQPEIKARKKMKTSQIKMPFQAKVVSAPRPIAHNGQYPLGLAGSIKRTGKRRADVPAD